MKIKTKHNCKCNPQLIIAAQTDDEAFTKLFHQFAPVYLKLWHDFYLTDMELCDWSQEAAIVFYHAIRKYDLAKQVTFGSFYKTSLRNHLFDILRKKRAKKRIPARCQASFSAYAEYYAETVQDDGAPDPLLLYEAYEDLQTVLLRCSQFERSVLSGALRQQTAQQIATRTATSVSQVSSALLRCRKKYFQQHCLT
ncbi:Sigma-70 region 2 [Fructilactobacillus florum 8D]|uniref:Sigma-70 region 2 n=1 Tax=Fructilactobacillus florum 8D TaxID=1221538 RepID=W9EKR8_9LACO|nr:sigma-70 family RNA polymerase sigma factor [Fructilactobacillus florum]ETO40269.1 Sigma-70 region 2 [Fructilactobacillus florum 8D]